MDFKDSLITPTKENVSEAYEKSPRYVLDQLKNDIRSKYVVKGTDDPYFRDDIQYKVDLVIEGGTFISVDLKFQNGFTFNILRLRQINQYPIHLTSDLSDITDDGLDLVIHSPLKFTETIKEIIKTKQFRFTILSNILL